MVQQLHQHTKFIQRNQKKILKEKYGVVCCQASYIEKERNKRINRNSLVGSYGIPPTLLRINEYGGPDVKEYQPTFDIRQRFTRIRFYK